MCVCVCACTCVCMSVYMSVSEGECVHECERVLCVRVSVHVCM